jgi:hypothetical protein
MNALVINCHTMESAFTLQYSLDVAMRSLRIGSLLQKRRRQHDQDDVGPLILGL